MVVFSRDVVLAEGSEAGFQNGNNRMDLPTSYEDTGYANYKLEDDPSGDWRSSDGSSSPPFNKMLLSSWSKILRIRWTMLVPSVKVNTTIPRNCVDLLDDAPLLGNGGKSDAFLL